MLLEQTKIQFSLVIETMQRYLEASQPDFKENSTGSPISLNMEISYINNTGIYSLTMFVKSLLKSLTTHQAVITTFWDEKKGMFLNFHSFICSTHLPNCANKYFARILVLLTAC